jgi:alpha-amylase/alpha-mannosidase (GH57 family)
MTQRYVCIHGHFYQPPRENPWLEMVEIQDSAYPFHDWNERITAECYGPNAVARILGSDGRITRLFNNYSRISFNFGPTLLAWMEAKVPDIYQRVLDADRESRDRFSGHGSALAQVYNHQIMPLADRTDKTTQVVWGIRDFRHRFGRDPEGMWLAETAADLETLEVLAEHGIRFTILAPNQAARVRQVGTKDWQDVSGSLIDPSVPYLQRLPSGKSIALFFYDGPVSRAVAFEKLLIRGEAFAGRILNAFSDQRLGVQLAHIATDGESYGHHHPHGDMALAYALDVIDSHPGVTLTNYGEFLAKDPPQWEVEIHENSSWSCIHGVERWKSNCGCNSGRPGWHQNWRGPLRDALNGLRDALRPPFEAVAARYLKDPWAARNGYIDVLLDRSRATQDRFLALHAKKRLGESEIVTVLKLMEMQRHLQLMYTSCGWFFDEISGIETVQVLMYAARAIQLAEELFGVNPEPGFLDELAKAPSNLPQAHRTGKDVYERYVRPARLGWKNMAAHHAVAALFDAPGESTAAYGHVVAQKDSRSHEAGRVRLVVGHATMISEVTREGADFAYAALHLGDHNVSAGVIEHPGDRDYKARAAELEEAFGRVDTPHIIRLIDRDFGEATYSLASLFRDLQRTILKRLLKAGLTEMTETFHRLYEQNLPLMRFLRHLSVPIPLPMQATTEVLFNTDLRWALKDDDPDFAQIRHLVREAQNWGLRLDTPVLEYRFGTMLRRAAERWREQPMNLELMELIATALDVARDMPFEPNLWALQNTFFDLIGTATAEHVRLAKTPDPTMRAWVDAFLTLGDKLGIDVRDLGKPSG